MSSTLKMSDSDSPLTPAQIAAADKLRSVRLSNDGSRVLYQVQPFHDTDYTIAPAALWIAETNRADSACQLTDGLFHDKSGVFHPDGKRVLFLSNRKDERRIFHLYAVDLSGGEPVLLAAEYSPRAFPRYDISPDGEHVAFASVEDEPNKNKSSNGNDDLTVSTSSNGLARLRVYSFSTGETRTLDIRGDIKIESFAWSPDGTQVMYRFQGEDQILLEKIGIADGNKPAPVGSYLRCPTSRSIWTASGGVVELQSYEPRLGSDATALFTHDPSTSFTAPIRLYGAEEDAIRIIDLKAQDMVAVEIATDMDSRIDVVSGGHSSVTIFKTEQNAIWYGAWDAKWLDDGSFVVAAVLSSAFKHQPPNVWVQRVAGDGTIKTKKKLSSHLKWLEDIPRFRTEVMRWKASDGTELDGLLRYPENSPDSEKPLPTVVHIHGGPYSRDVPDFMPFFCNWRELLACAGYLVLTPNFRGSQGRGHTFASTEYSASGTRLDWSDCESMVDEAVKRGIADPMRLGVAGWSHGGYLAAWGTTQTKNKFRAAVVGGAMSGWISREAEPTLHAHNVSSDSGKSSTTIRGDNPADHVQGIETAMLIMHGEMDQGVPVSQAIEFMSELERQAKYPERSQLVIYPREPHGIEERRNAEDILNRVLEHVNQWLSR